MPTIDPSTQIKADGDRYTIGTGPETPTVPADGDTYVWDAATQTWTFAPGGGGGVTDHGALTGLADDDHPYVSEGIGSVGILSIGSTEPTSPVNGDIWLDTTGA